MEAQQTMNVSLRVLVAVASAMAMGSAAVGQEFINYRGPTGNGTYPGVGLLKEWLAEGPPLLWKFAAGADWAAPAMVDGKVYVVGGTTGQLWVLDLNGQAMDRIYVGAMDWQRNPEGDSPVMRRNSRENCWMLP
jgi:hypothetical protein